MTTEEICLQQSETIEKQAHLIVSLLREVMQYRELTAEEQKIIQDDSWDSVSKLGSAGRAGGI